VSRISILIGAVGDIHAPKFLDEFKRSLTVFDSSRLDLFLLAGDLILKGDFTNLEHILEAIEQKGFNCPVLACFGNEEYSDIRDQVRKIAGDKVKFLDDESMVLVVRDVQVGIVGSQGSLESPTPWQAKNVPDIEKTYSDRIDKIAQLLTGLETDLRILLTHYPPTYKVLKGEWMMFYPHIGCDRCERIISKDKVDAAICAHSHMGIPFALVNGVPVHNVSLPVVHKISSIKISKQRRSINVRKCDMRVLERE
jgi:Icc-related predicted phosphoesterase